MGSVGAYVVSHSFTLFQVFVEGCVAARGLLTQVYTNTSRFHNTHRSSGMHTSAHAYMHACT